tara:strand:+ start:163 stop:309 length:147 start_codon:yes stop_codon:yes gene_type:complete
LQLSLEVDFFVFLRNIAATYHHIAVIRPDDEKGEKNEKMHTVLREYWS